MWAHYFSYYHSSSSYKFQGLSWYIQVQKGTFGGRVRFASVLFLHKIDLLLDYDSSISARQDHKPQVKSSETHFFPNYAEKHCGCAVTWSEILT